MAVLESWGRKQYIDELNTMVGKGVMMVTKTLNKLLDERIMDLQLTAGNSTFSDAHRMAARARIEELEWVKGVKDERD